MDRPLPNGTGIAGRVAGGVRIVRDPRAEPTRALFRANAQVIRAAEGVRRENLAAARLAEHDVRIVFAEAVATSLEGGRAAILRPERRQRLLAKAEDLGLRPFDANLVIAIAQDAARTGHRGHDARLELVPGPSHVGTRRSLVMRATLIIALAATIFLALVRWIE